MTVKICTVKNNFGPSLSFKFLPCVCLSFQCLLKDSFLLILHHHVPFIHQLAKYGFSLEVNFWERPSKCTSGPPRGQLCDVCIRSGNVELPSCSSPLFWFLEHSCPCFFSNFSDATFFMSCTSSSVCPAPSVLFCPYNWAAAPHQHFPYGSSCPSTCIFQWLPNFNLSASKTVIGSIP